MFRLNRLTDYAVVILSQMNARADEMQTAPRISQITGVPQPTVAKLLNALANADLITSHRGASGGYTLSRAAREITVADIIQALEGPIALTACVEGSPSGCEVETLCPMRGNWEKVNRAIHGALESVTLAEMALNEMVLPPPPAAEARRATDRLAGMD